MPATRFPELEQEDRVWGDYDPRTNTFLDTRTGTRVRPDGTPYEEGATLTPQLARGHVPIEDIDTGPIPSEVPRSSEREGGYDDYSPPQTELQRFVGAAPEAINRARAGAIPLYGALGEGLRKIPGLEQVFTPISKAMEHPAIEGTVGNIFPPVVGSIKGPLGEGGRVIGKKVSKEAIDISDLAKQRLEEFRNKPLTGKEKAEITRNLKSAEKLLEEVKANVEGGFASEGTLAQYQRNVDYLAEAQKRARAGRPAHEVFQEGEYKVPEPAAPGEMTQDELDARELQSQGPTYGDWYTTPEGNFVTTRGGGGLGSDRVGTYDVNGDFVGWQNRSDLQFVQKSQRTISANTDASAWAETVSTDVKALREQNATVLMKADLYDRFTKELEAGRITPEQFKAAQDNGTISTLAEYQQAQEVRRKITEVRNTPITRSNAPEPKPQADVPTPEVVQGAEELLPGTRSPGVMEPPPQPPVEPLTQTERVRLLGLTQDEAEGGLSAGQRQDLEDLRARSEAGRRPIDAPDPNAPLTRDEIRQATDLKLGITKGKEAEIREAIETERKRKFGLSVETAPGTTEPLRQSLAKEPLTYKRITRPETEAAARRVLEADPEGTLAQVLDPNVPGTATQFQSGLILLHKAQEEGNTALARQITQAMAEKATPLGRAIDILSQIDRLSPEGVEWLITQHIERYIAKGGSAKKVGQRLAKIDQEMQKASRATKVRSIQEAIRVQRPMSAKAFIADLEDFFKNEVGAVRLKAPTDFDMMPEDINRFWQKGQDLKAMPPGPERDAAKDALRQEFEAFRQQELKSEAVKLGLKTPEARKVLKDAEALQRFEKDQATRLTRLAQAQERMATRTLQKDVEREAHQIAENARAEAAQLRRDAKALEQFDAEQAKILTRHADQLDKEGNMAWAAIARAEQQTGNAAMEMTIKGLRADAKRVKQDAVDMARLADGYIPDAKKRAVNEERRLKNAAIKAVSENGLALPKDLAQMFMDRGAEISKLPPGMQRDRLTKAFMRDISNLIPPSRWNLALDLFGNFSKTIKSSWDASYMIRQGALLGIKHPKEWWNTWGPMLHGMKDPEFAKQLMDNLATNDLANVRHSMGVAFDELYEGGEFFTSQAAAKIPGVNMSNRAFNIAGNKLRADSVDATLLDWLGQDWDFTTRPLNTLEDIVAATGKTEQEFKDLALLTNALSGKSSLHHLLRNNTFVDRVLGLTFWAPSWTLAIPEAVARSTVIGSGSVRKIGAEALVKYYGFYTGMLGLGAVSGTIDTDWDPRSSNFLKWRLKGTLTWHDQSLGMGLLLRTVGQLMPTPGPNGIRPYKKDANGHLVPQKPGVPVGKWVRAKLQPTIGEINNWRLGEDPVGRSRRFKEGDLGHNLGVVGSTLESLFVPLTPDEIMQAAYEDGLRGAVLTLPSLIGGSEGTYQSFADQQQAVTDKLFPGKQYSALPRGDQNAVNDSPEIKAEIAKFEDPGMPIEDKMTFAYKGLADAKQRIEFGTPATEGSAYKPGIKDFVDSMEPGESLRKKIQEAKHDMYRASADYLTPDILAFSPKSAQLVDIYAQKWLNVPLEEDLVTGEKNFKKQDLERQAIYQEARPALEAAGKTLEYFTGHGEGAFRKKQWKDPKVQARFEEYERDQETLKPYWEVPEKYQELIPGVKELLEAGKADPIAQSFLPRFKIYQDYQKFVGIERKAMLANPEMLRALRKWHPEVLSREALIAAEATR